MIGMIIGLIALGLFALVSVALTVKWIVKRIKSKRTAKNIGKVLVSDIKNLARSCNNSVTLGQLDSLVNDGYTHVMADINTTGDVVGEVEIIRDTSYSRDDSVRTLLGGSGMVVVDVE